VLRFQSGLELLFGEAIPGNGAPAWNEKSSMGRRQEVVQFEIQRAERADPPGAMILA